MRIKKPVITSDQAWAMKREGQVQSRELVSSGKILPEAVFFLRGDQVKNAKLSWSAAPLSRAALRRQKTK